MPLCLYMPYSRSECFFALKRFVVIIVVLVVDFISTSHALILLFKAVKSGDFGVVGPQARVLIELAFGLHAAIHALDRQSLACWLVPV